ncbi:hypothetical protein J0X15_16340 [Roseibium sp. CAU 1637]|uniref:Uncharacterized protein n=1 Tax=Roseibium limicola TaxID=2816037 RepID=A0A939EQM4_9HYPH|nr:hypothetical protein [Roseibium limicola]MBO0346797.1 hypothetical protein [Roseibium limicola]
MQVTRSSSIPNLMTGTRHQGDEGEPGGQRKPPFYLAESKTPDSSAAHETEPTIVPRAGAIAYSPTLISLTTNVDRDNASTDLAQRSGAAAYRAAGRVVTTMPAGHLLAASF